MSAANDRQAAEAIARRVVAETAPGEMALFDVTASAYFTDPRRAVKVARGEARDDTLGFGLEVAEAVPVVTTAALWVTQEVLRWVAVQVRESLHEESAGIVQQWVRWLLRRVRPGRGDDPSQHTPARLTPEQLRQVREVAVQKARELLPERQATAVGDSIVATLVLPAPGA